VIFRVGACTVDVALGGVVGGAVELPGEGVPARISLDAGEPEEPSLGEPGDLVLEEFAPAAIVPGEVVLEELVLGEVLPEEEFDGLEDEGADCFG
jgi:hypothetical protein